MFPYRMLVSGNSDIKRLGKRKPPDIVKAEH